MAEVSLRQQGDTWVLTDEEPDSTEPIVWMAEGKDYAILEAFLDVVPPPLKPETVRNWCKQYGLPSVERRESGTAKACLTVDAFNRHLTYLWDVVRLWRAFDNEDKEQLRELSSQHFGVPASTFDTYNLSQLCDTGRQALARYLDILTRGQLSLVPVFTETGKLALQYQAQTLWSLAMLQLETLCIKPGPAHLLECTACHRSFVGHVNRKYCDHCNRKTIHSRKTRNSQRQARSV